mmetsp:Transcript_28935/g.54376  ORF Transcript_28935/g.54376 Transcript_28935/m.54376 type:complete len:215 (-) Transcript_28935:62-706(-)
MKKIEFFDCYLSGSGGGFGNLLGRLGALLLVQVPDSEGSKSLHKTSSVVTSRGVGKSEHSLCQFTVELGLRVAEGGFDVDELLEVVEVSVHLDNLAFLSEVVFRSRLELHSRSRGGKLFRRRSPFDGRSRVEQVGSGEVRNTFLLDASHTKSLLVFGVQGSWKHFNDHITELLLGIDVSIEVGLSGFDRGHDGFEGVPTFFHVTLDLPVELDFW